MLWLLHCPLTYPIGDSAFSAKNPRFVWLVMSFCPLDDHPQLNREGQLALLPLYAWAVERKEWSANSCRVCSAPGASASLGCRARVLPVTKARTFCSTLVRGPPFSPSSPLPWLLHSLPPYPFKGNQGYSWNTSFTQQTFEAPHVASALGAAPTSHHRLSAPKERKARGVGVEALFQKCPGRSSWWDGLWSEHPPPPPWRSKLWGDLREGSAPQVEGAVPGKTFRQECA